MREDARIHGVLFIVVIVAASDVILATCLQQPHQRLRPINTTIHAGADMLLPLAVHAGSRVLTHAAAAGDAGVCVPAGAQC